MGEGFAVAVPVILVVAFAVALIVRGRRAEAARSAAQHAPWRVGSEPNGGAVLVYLYQEVGGVEANREPYVRIPRLGDYQQDLLQALSEAELEASMLNDRI